VSDFVSDDVRAFLRENIESYEELEVLLLLQRESVGPWNARALAARLHLPAPLLHEALGALRSRKLVDRWFDGTEECYRLAADMAANETLASLATLYASHAVEIIKLMSTHSIERIRTAALRSFADAFVFRKDKKNG
jgi:DNA-binding IclR family transcriptional regulator